MEKEFVSYEQAVALKDLGFDGDYLKVYSTKWQKILDEEYAVRYDVDYAPAPLKQQVFRWFRDNYDMIGYSERLICGSYEDVISSPYLLDWEDDITFSTYEEAENNCINRLIELAKQK